MRDKHPTRFQSRNLSTETTWAPLLLCALLLGLAADAEAKQGKKKKKEAGDADPYAEYVWPPPPDKPRIKLEAIFSQRTDVEAKKSGWRKRIVGAAPAEPYDRLKKPVAVAFDPEGRVLVTDWESKALYRFDSEAQRMDVFGTRTNIRLKEPMGVEVAADGTIYVADAGESTVLAFAPSGDLEAWYGKDDLDNPTDVAVSPDGTRLYVADSKAHQIAVFDVASRKLFSTLGRQGAGDGEFAFPTALAFGPEGNLFVVDQLNARVQVLDPDGEYMDQFGGRGVGFGNFVRPKGIAVDETGFIYVTDFSFNNFQLFDADFSLLTFVGAGGTAPGSFKGAFGIAVQGERIAVVDQLGARVQIFRFLVPKAAE